MLSNFKKNLMGLWFIINISFSINVEGALVYSALDPALGFWQIHWQTTLSATPQVISLPIMGDHSAPRLSPNGKEVAFEVQNKGIYICTLETVPSCKIVKTKKGMAVRPTWHPYTQQLIFVRYLVDQSNEESDIFNHLIPSGSNKILLQQTGIQDYPEVSPDSRSLVYSSSQTTMLYQAGVKVIQSIWMADLTIGNTSQLLLSDAQDIHPSWSPDSKTLAFASNRNGQFNIWTVNIDGSNLKKLTSGTDSKTWPTWSPNGEMILFTLNHKGHQSLWLINRDGSQLRPFQPFNTKNIQLRDAHWQGKQL